MLDAARRKVAGMVSAMSKEVKPNLLKIADTQREPPGAEMISSHSAAELQLWFEPEALEDVRLMFEQANDPQAKAELIQLVPAPVLKHLGLAA